MTGSETDIQWFIARDGKQHGPVSDIELKKLVELGHLKPADLVWRQGFSDWRTASSVFPTIGDTPRPAAPPHPPSAAKAPAPTTPAPAQKPQAPGQSPGPGAGAGPTLGHPGPQPAKPQAGAASAAGRPQPQLSTGFSPQTGAAPGAGQLSPAGAGDPRRAGSGPNLGPNPNFGPGPSLGDARPDPSMGTRPLGNAPRAAGPSGPAPQMAVPGPHLGPDPRIAAGPGSSIHHEPAAPARRRKAPLVVAGLLLMGGVGAWLGSQYTEQIFAVIQSENGASTSETGTTTANLAPQPEEKKAETPPPATSGPTLQDIDRTLQGRTVWVSVKQEFPDWYQSRVADIARLTSENKSDAEITAYLVNQLVQLRRENAKHALAASSPRHKDLAAAFLANLRDLAREGGDGCYDFISRGETSPIAIRRMQDPAQSAQIEAQLVAVFAAISEGRKTPAEHTAPVKTDYDLLAGELGRLGWTQADMQLFANPRELAQAPRERVCSMLQDWFAAHLAIQDQASQQRLLFETLKPVVSG
mgnify:CR=1 FL=1